MLLWVCCDFFFFKQKTAYEMRISDWSSDVCSSDLSYSALEPYVSRSTLQLHYGKHHRAYVEKTKALAKQLRLADKPLEKIIALTAGQDRHRALFQNAAQAWNHARSEEHTSELQSLMRTSYAVFCLKKKKTST